jgi:hypothetical protein
VFQRLRDGESECVETEGEFLVTNDKDGVGSSRGSEKVAQRREKRDNP